MSEYFSEDEVRRRMANRELYSDAYPGLEGLEAERDRAKLLAARFNQTTPAEKDLRKHLLA